MNQKTFESKNILYLLLHTDKQTFGAYSLLITGNITSKPWWNLNANDSYVSKILPDWSLTLRLNVQTSGEIDAALIKVGFFSAVFYVEQIASLMLQGDTPKHRAEKAKDAELAAYLENRQHYQMIQREDQETAVWLCSLTSSTTSLSPIPVPNLL